jgi:hypothetical protein
MTADGTGLACFAATASATCSIAGPTRIADLTRVMTRMSQTRQIFPVYCEDPSTEAWVQAYYRVVVIRWLERGDALP